MSSGNKKVILLLLAVAIIALTYMYVYMPTKDENDSLESEITSLEAKYNDLKQKDLKREEYTKGIKEFNTKFDEILTYFPGDLNQEVSVMFMKGLDNAYIKANEDGFDIKSVGLGRETDFYSLGGNSEGYACKTATFPISYEGSYDGIKAIMDYVMNYKYRMNISNVSISYDVETGLCTGAIALNAYSISGADRKGDSVELDLDHTEGGNIFEGGTGAPTQAPTYKYDSDEGESITNDYDLIMMLNSANNDSASGIILADANSSEESYVTDSSNSEVDVKITVYNDSDKNFVLYEIGDNSYEFELTTDDLSIYVNSSERVDADDKNGVNVSVSNKTDIPVFFKVKNDDSTSPRFKLSGKTGVVKVY